MKVKKERSGCQERLQLYRTLSLKVYGSTRAYWENKKGKWGSRQEKQGGRAAGLRSR